MYLFYILHYDKYHDIRKRESDLENFPNFFFLAFCSTQNDFIVDFNQIFVYTFLIAIPNKR